VQDHRIAVGPGVPGDQVADVAEEAVVLEIGVRPVLHAFEHGEAVVEAVRERAVGERPAEVDPGGVAGDGVRSDREEIAAHVELADEGAAVAGVLQDVAQRHLARLDLRLPVELPGAPLPAAAPLVVAGQDAVAAGRALGGRGVGIGEAHALARQPVQVGRGDARGGVVGAQVAPAHVVGEKDDDVGRGGGRGTHGEEAQQCGEDGAADQLDGRHEPSPGVAGLRTRCRAGP
jgi:hypothetical protein